MEFNGKKLLVLGGIRLACDIVTRAKKMGAYVVVADYLVDSPAKKIADEGVLINAMDVDALVDYCIEAHVDGVTTGFVDILLKPCYEVCKRLGLPCYLTQEMIEISTNKIAFKDTCDKYGIPVPQTYLVGSRISDEVYAKINYPVFVKPLDASGSRGAGVCCNREELDRQFAEAVGFSATKNAVIEDYLTGREFLMNFIAQDGEFRMISMFDRYVTSDRSSAINYASLSMGPSKAVDFYLNEMNDRVVNMFRSLGFRDGIYFLQGYSDGDKITFYEMGCRLGGSYYDLEKKCIDVDPIDMLIRYALSGRMCDPLTSVPVAVGKYDKIAVCVNFLLDGKEGTVHKISGIDEIKQLPSFVYGDQVCFEGYHYEGDRVVDKPVLSVYLVVDDLKQLIEDVNYMNVVFTVTDSEGKSLLKEKYDPTLLLREY